MPVGGESFPWAQVLGLLEERRVIPVVGQELLQTPGSERLLTDSLAEHLAERLHVRLEEGAPLSLTEVATRHREASGRPGEAYGALWELRSKLDELAIPQSLIQLAELPCPLYITTTFDPLLERAINKVRFDGKKKTRVLSYYPGQPPEDLPVTFKNLDPPVVFHLFGQLGPLPCYALTEEDLLECVWSLQSRRPQLPLLFEALKHCSLLLIGNSYPDWLARFFLRATTRMRFSQATDRQDFLADADLKRDPALVLFLQRFGVGTRLFLQGNATAFVAALHGRWTELHPLPPDGAPSPPAQPTAMPRGAVFISYASQDRPRVEVLKEALEKAGIDVWFDRQELEFGDLWKQKIERNIAACSFFVPVLSRETLTEGRREFRFEWDKARLERQKARRDLPFLLPVVIDDVPLGSAGFPPEFNDPHACFWGEGPVDPQFILRLRELYRGFHKTTEGPP